MTLILPSGYDIRDLSAFLFITAVVLHTIYVTESSCANISIYQSLNDAKPPYNLVLAHKNR